MKDKNRLQKEELNISNWEREIIYDIRRLKYGRVVVYIQDGVIINKEATEITKMPKTFDRHS